MVKKRTQWQADIQSVADIFYYHFEPRDLSDGFVTKTLTHFIKELPLTEVHDAMGMSCTKFGVPYIDRNDTERLEAMSEQTVKYFCGICWSRIKQSMSQTVVIDKNGE